LGEVLHITSSLINHDKWLCLASSEVKSDDCGVLQLHVLFLSIEERC